MSDPNQFPADAEYPGLFAGHFGPSASALDAASEGPLAIFLYLLPLKMWNMIRDETNRYQRQQIAIRAAKIRERQKKNKVKNTETKAQIRARLRAEHPFQTVDLLRAMGLLIARMMCPHKQRIGRHWGSSAEGAIPKGTFGAYMPRNRFDQLMRSLHFSNNHDSRASTDRAWKVRPIVDVLQVTFKRGYTAGVPVLSFDEGVLPSRSRYNPIRQYMKDKPHKWGTKMFLTCCASTAYCLR